MEMLTLVIIEDEESHFDLMKRAIAGKFPYASVYHFQEAETCLERLDEINPTVIITDYLMPGMDGIEFLEVLNQTDIDIPVIMITGHGDENVAVRAMKLGAKDYLVCLMSICSLKAFFENSTPVCLGATVVFFKTTMPVVFETWSKDLRIQSVPRHNF
ncbi:MAG: response regulator [Deltaproteobacteria bacterium]|nr:response regulator [Deltaproteobacteria bacterium]